MIPRLLARLFLAAALLVAQQSALAHQIWHFTAAPAPAQHSAGGGAQDTNAGGKALCDMHTALGAVLGALGCAGAAPDFKSPQADAIPAAALTLAALARLAPSSRDPPRLR